MITYNPSAFFLDISVKKYKRGGYIVAEQMTVSRPLGNDRTIRQPKYHFVRSDARQSTDVDEECDHIIQDGVSQAFELKLLSPFKNCGSTKILYPFS